MSLLTAREAARRLGVSERTFYRAKRRGELRNVIARNAVGIRQYIPEAIDAINRGESTTKLIHRGRP